MPTGYNQRKNFTTRKHKPQQALYAAIAILLVVALLIFNLGLLIGWYVGIAYAVDATPTSPSDQPFRSTTQNHPDIETPEIILTNLIVSEGNALSPELQKIMQEKCEEYDVPYVLALALADQETRFDPDAASGTNDYGLMQINSINFEWLRERGIDPQTYEGNIEAGVLILSKAINRYGDYGLALMAYNCGDTGAKRLWDAGTYSTKYSREVLERYNKWVQIVEGN